MTYEFSNISVLVVESNRAMFDLTKGVLLYFGASKVISAYSVEEGYEKFCSHKPDLVIIDWLDKDSSGIDLTQRIRDTDTSPNPFVPIIIMTGFSQKRRVVMARDSGITEFIVKPYTASALYQKIESIIENPRKFIKSKSFFGPDRRRRMENFDGIDRRHPENMSRMASDTARAIKDRSKKESS